MQFILALLVYFVVMFVVGRYGGKSANMTAERFCVGNRKMGTVTSALSIAATWIWAPALFVSAENAFKYGKWGFLWFFVPNVITLIIFIPFALNVKSKMPSGTAITDYIGVRYGSKTKTMYKLTLKSVCVLSTAVQLLAGASILSGLLGGGKFAFFAITVCMAMAVYAYSYKSGFEASVRTDVVQMVFMIICGIFIFFLAQGKPVSFIGTLPDTSFVTVSLTFGISTAIGLISGIMGDQCFWQRAYAAKDLKKSFVLGAVFFAIIPLTMGYAGFVGSASGMENFDMIAILQYLTNDSRIMVLYVIMIVSGLCSTIDSNLSAVTSFAPDKETVKQARRNMIVVLAIGICIANIPGITISDLFLFYGALRSVLLLSTMVSVSNVELSDKAVSGGILAALVVGIPMFAYATAIGSWELKLLANGIILVMPLTVSFSAKMIEVVKK